MAFGVLLWLAAAAQIGGLPVKPSSYQMVRADALMRRAWQGRSEAVRRLCGDQGRVARLRVVDSGFMRVQQAYQRRFGEAWQGIGVISEGRLAADYRASVAGVTSQDRTIDPRCQSPTGFAGAIGEYQNGVTLATAELGS